MLKTYLRPWPARYELLDGLRGLACLGVLIHHLGIFYVGHYCVMTFFVISGYCISASAQSCFRRGVSFGGYLARRAHRIYPPYLLAVLFFAATRLLKVSLGRANFWHPGTLQWLQNLTLTRWISDLFHPVRWPADNPVLFVSAFWSLNYEEQFYLIVGLSLIVAARVRHGLVGLVLLLAALGLTWDISHPAGPITGVFLKYWPHFALGCCLYLVLCEYTGSLSRGAFIAGTLILGAFSALHIFPWHGDATQNAWRVYVELSVLSMVGLMLLLLRPVSAAISSSRLWRPVGAVGIISYSLYLVHQFNLVLVRSIANAIVPAAAPSAVSMTTQVLLHLSLATGFWLLFERPFLNRGAPVLHAIPRPASERRPAPQPNS
jgi:peptidoglycan/LPS O-acetylase OafA/YrhL